MNDDPIFQELNKIVEFVLLTITKSNRKSAFYGINLEDFFVLTKWLYVLHLILLQMTKNVSTHSHLQV
jgi:hypothetical protein